MLDMLQEFEKKIKAKRKELEEEENALKVFKRSMGISEESEPLNKPLPVTQDDQNFDDLFNGAGVGKRRFLIDHIRDLVPRFGAKVFTVAIVHAALIKEGVEIEAKQPRSRIASALGKLVDEGRLKLEAKGSGNQPSYYKVKDEAKEVEDNDISDLIGDESPSDQA